MRKITSIFFALVLASASTFAQERAPSPRRAFQPAPFLFTYTGTDAAAVVVSAAKFVKPTGSRSVNRRKKRKRIKSVVHRKPPTVIVLPDVIRVMSAAEVEAERRAREAVKWVTWF